VLSGWAKTLPDSVSATAQAVVMNRNLCMKDPKFQQATLYRSKMFRAQNTVRPTPSF
jgi:hypothetical protein